MIPARVLDITVNSRVLLWAETAAGLPGSRQAGCWHCTCCRQTRISAPGQGQWLDSEIILSEYKTYHGSGSGSMIRTRAAAAAMPSGASVTVLSLPLRVTGTESLCYDSDDNAAARLVRIIVTDHCEPDLEAAAAGGRALQASLRRRDCQ